MKIRFVIVLFFFVNINIASGQSEKDSLSFPQSWQGKWQGELEIFSPKGLLQSLPMALHIIPIKNSDRYTWTIYYGEDTIKGKRDYELIPIDPLNGVYVIDEKNSIQMEGYFLGGKYFQRFEVMGSLLLTTTEKVNDSEIIWEIISGKLEPVSYSGNKTFEEEEIPEVKTYPIQVVQRARLQKD